MSLFAIRYLVFFIVGEELKYVSNSLQCRRKKARKRYDAKGIIAKSGHKYGDD